MSAKVARLRGLARIRGLQEELERRSLAAAVSAVSEVERALRVDEAALVEARVISREALREGDRGEWLLADAQAEVARANMGKLEIVRARREAEVPMAMARFLACRREHEQAKVLVDEARLAAMAESARREQAAADDWVISRWNRTQGLLRGANRLRLMSGERRAFCLDVERVI